MLLHLVADYWDRWLRAQVYHITEFQMGGKKILYKLRRRSSSTSRDYIYFSEARSRGKEKNSAALNIGSFEDIG